MNIGYNSEYGKLESVFINIPKRGEIDNLLEVDEAMYVSQPNYDLVIHEIDLYIKKLKELGIEVFDNTNTPDYLYYPNSIYARDVAAITHDSIVLGSMKFDVRQGEELNFMKFIRSNEYIDKLIEFRTGDVTFEGADLLRTGPNEFSIAVGNRTSKEVAETLELLYPDMDIRRVTARPEGIPQHLLGAHLIVDEDLIIRRTELTDNTLGFINSINLKETEEVKYKYATNLLCVGPREIIMPDDCPETQAIYESYGIKCHVSPMSEIRKMAGGFACMTNIFKRETVK